jgi:uncharacterized protein (TIGR00255 family)
MNSMTGHGRAKVSFSGSELTVEISSVNRKQIELVVSLPRQFAELEPRLREEIGPVVTRGRISINVSFHNGKSRRAQAIDFSAAADYYRQLEKLRRKLGITEPIPLDAVLRGPNVVMETDDALSLDLVWPHLQSATSRALRQFLAMRKKEGLALAKDSANRIQAIGRAVNQIAKLSPSVVERYRENLRSRLRDAKLEIDFNDERLLKEIALFADRSDISEELTRLSSHLQQFTSLLGKNDSVGRTLDFLIQEINREVNTIGSKANDIAISRAVVDIKTELEKIREQVQNIE